MDDMTIMDEFAKINEKLDKLLAKKPQTAFGTPGEAPPDPSLAPPWQYKLDAMGWTEEQFAEQVKQRMKAKVDCWKDIPEVQAFKKEKPQYFTDMG